MMIHYEYGSQEKDREFREGVEQWLAELEERRKYYGKLSQCLKKESTYKKIKEDRVDTIIAFLFVFLVLEVLIIYYIL